MSPTDLAKLIDLPSPNAIFNFLGGRTASLHLQTIEDILRAIPDATFHELVGLCRPLTASVGKQESEHPSIMVTLELEVGLWQVHRELPPNQWVALTLPADFPGQTEDLFAARVGEPGAEKAYPTNSILLCRRLPRGSKIIPAGTRCIVRQTRRTKTEITVREMRYHDGEPWLWSLATDPNHQQPIQLSTKDDGTIAENEHRAAVEILGVVIASWQPEAATNNA